MSRTGHELQRLFPDLLEHVSGSLETAISSLAAVETAPAGSLVFASETGHLDEFLKSSAAAVVTTKKILTGHALPANKTVFVTPHTGLALAQIGLLFYSGERQKKREGFIHPRAVVADDARIGKNTVIEAGAVIGSAAVVGNDCFIGANCIVEDGVLIGDGTTLWPLVFVGARCKIGQECTIHPNTTIGKDGFGFAQDKEGRHHRLPQIGIVRVGNRVEIGANCVIDRAAFNETSIGDGTKLDNLAHISHNCQLGKDSLFTARFTVAGSTKIGNNVMTGGRVTVTDHVNITDKVMLGGLAAVTKDVTEPGAYGGYPLQPLRDYFKTTSSIPHLVRLRKDVAKILKHLGLASEESEQ